MKNKKSISIKLKKVSISNFSSIHGGIGSEASYFCSAYCTTPKECPTTVDPRTDDDFRTAVDC